MSDGEVFGISVASDNRYIMELQAETSTGTVDPILVHRFSGQEFVNVGRSARLLLEDRPGLFILDHRRKTTPAAQVRVTARYFWLPENEPNDSPETATPVPPQSRMMGWLTEPNPGPDVDWFRFSADPTTAYVISAWAPGGYFRRDGVEVPPPELEFWVGDSGQDMHRCLFAPGSTPPTLQGRNVLVFPQNDHFYVRMSDIRNISEPYRGWTPENWFEEGLLGHYILSVSKQDFEILGPPVRVTTSSTLTLQFERAGTHLVEMRNSRPSRLSIRVVQALDAESRGNLALNGSVCGSLTNLPMVLDVPNDSSPHKILLMGQPVTSPQTTPQIQYYFSLTPQ